MVGCTGNKNVISCLNIAHNRYVWLFVPLLVIGFWSTKCCFLFLCGYCAKVSFAKYGPIVLESFLIVWPTFNVTKKVWYNPYLWYCCIKQTFLSTTISAGVSLAIQTRKTFLLWFIPVSLQEKCYHSREFICGKNAYSYRSTKVLSGRVGHLTPTTFPMVHLNFCSRYLFTCNVLIDCCYSYSLQGMKNSDWWGM